MKNWLIFLLLTASTISFAQQTVQRDTSLIKARSFNEKALRDFKNDKQFQYDKLVEPPQSMWDRFWSWFWWKVSQLLGTKQGRTTMWTVFIVFGVSMIVFFVFKVMGMNKDGLFGKSSFGKFDYSITHEDIHRISFEEAIREAVEGGNYRLAIRLLYLQSLKTLTDKGYVQWQINKKVNISSMEVKKPMVVLISFVVK